MAGSTEELLDTASMYLASFRASQSVSMRFTSDLEMSGSTVVMAPTSRREGGRLRVPPVVPYSSFRDKSDGLPGRKQVG